MECDLATPEGFDLVRPDGRSLRHRGADAVTRGGAVSAAGASPAGPARRAPVEVFHAVALRGDLRR
jgi:hypothetical protein